MSATVDGIVLAAGLSTRAGAFKMELDLGGKALIERSIEGMYPVVDRVIVVGGHKIERIRDILRGYAKVEIVLNESYRDGMFSSVKEGLKHVRGGACFLLPGDHPTVAEETYRRMLSVSADVVIPTHEGRKGHPVLMRSGLIDDVLRQPGDSSLRDFLRQTGYVTVEVDDEGIFLDVDHPEDYQAMKRVYEDEH